MIVNFIQDNSPVYIFVLLNYRIRFSIGGSWHSCAQPGFLLAGVQANISRILLSYWRKLALLCSAWLSIGWRSIKHFPYSSFLLTEAGTAVLSLAFYWLALYNKVYLAKVASAISLAFSTLCLPIKLTTQVA